MLGTIWEALSPDPCLSPYQTDCKWLTQVYESVKPPSGNGKLLWHALGAKTVELINANVHLESVRDDIETLVLDADVLEEILADVEPGKRAKEVEIKLIARLRKHLGHPTFTALGERLEKIKERHEQGFLTSLEFLKQILAIAREVVEAEKEADPEEERDRAKEALTELFQEAKNTKLLSGGCGFAPPVGHGGSNEWRECQCSGGHAETLCRCTVCHGLPDLASNRTQHALHSTTMPARCT